MKKIKKLSLNKEVVSILGGNDMNLVRGGTAYTINCGGGIANTINSCAATCANTCGQLTCANTCDQLTCANTCGQLTCANTCGQLTCVATCATCIPTMVCK